VLSLDRGTEYNLAIALRALASGHPLPLLTIPLSPPTYVPDLVNATLDLLMKSVVWHWRIQGDYLGRSGTLRCQQGGTRRQAN